MVDDKSLEATHFLTNKMSYTYCASLLLSPVNVLCKQEVSVRGGHSTMRCGEGLY